jgi:hypothetical protein
VLITASLLLRSVALAGIGLLKGLVSAYGRQQAAGQMRSVELNVPQPHPPAGGVGGVGVAQARVVEASELRADRFPAASSASTPRV